MVTGFLGVLGKGPCESYCEKMVIGYWLSVRVLGEVGCCWKGGANMNLT